MELHGRRGLERLLHLAATSSLEGAVLLLGKTKKVGAALPAHPAA